MSLSNSIIERVVAGSSPAEALHEALSSSDLKTVQDFYNNVFLKQRGIKGQGAVELKKSLKKDSKLVYIVASFSKLSDADAFYTWASKDLAGQFNIRPVNRYGISQYPNAVYMLEK